MPNTEHFALPPDRPTSLAGRKYRGFGGCVYELLSHHPCGFHLQVIDDSDDKEGYRRKGEFACISERAIGRTYHELRDPIEDT